MNMRHVSVVVSVVAVVFLAGCEPASTGGSHSAQSSADIAEAQKRIVPTQHLFADADRKLVEKAIGGYMKAVFPIATEEPGFFETETMEWVNGPMPHRTRVTVELETVKDRPANVVMHVAALKIEPLIDEAKLRSGRPMTWTWRLEGSRREIEEVVVGQIVRRYLLLRQGRNPDEVPLDGPIPGLSPPQKGFFKPGTSGGKVKGKN